MDMKKKGFVLAKTLSQVRVLRRHGREVGGPRPVEVVSIEMEGRWRASEERGWFSPYTLLTCGGPA